MADGKKWVRNMHIRMDDATAEDATVVVDYMEGQGMGTSSADLLRYALRQTRRMIEAAAPDLPIVEPDAQAPPKPAKPRKPTAKQG